MNKIIEFARLESLIANCQDNLELPIITNSVVIDLLELDKFITQAKGTPACDGIRIHFIRHELDNDQDHIRKALVANETYKNLSQLPLAFVPADT